MFINYVDISLTPSPLACSMYLVYGCPLWFATNPIWSLMNNLLLWISIVSFMKRMLNQNILSTSFLYYGCKKVRLFILSHLTYTSFKSSYFISVNAIYNIFVKINFEFFYPGMVPGMFKKFLYYIYKNTLFLALFN